MITNEKNKQRKANNASIIITTKQQDQLDEIRIAYKAQEIKLKKVIEFTTAKEIDISTSKEIENSIQINILNSPYVAVSDPTLSQHCE